jgi:peptidoglycan/xylan/chitin deacetylase (PgdA/CDA1 family)
MWSSNGSIVVMYHELEVPARRLCDDDRGYTQYVVRKSDFEEHVAVLRANGFMGTTVSHLMRICDHECAQVTMTFDDGCETDLVTAAPVLLEAGFQATFYVVSGWLGTRGHLSEAQVRELAQLGFEVGSHSLTHAFLPELPISTVRRELLESKKRLEQITGKTVQHFSCPGGGCDERIAQLAQEAGYTTLATSNVGKNSHGCFQLSRIAVTRDMRSSEVLTLCSGKGLLRQQVRGAILHRMRALLGFSAYQRVRSCILDLGNHS